MPLTPFCARCTKNARYYIVVIDSPWKKNPISAWVADTEEQKNRILETLDMPPDRVEVFYGVQLAKGLSTTWKGVHKEATFEKEKPTLPLPPSPANVSDIFEEEDDF